jgi:hypothetical protein
MNNTFKELLKQAEERYPRHLAVAVPEVQLRQDALEKFAELIVKECITVCNSRVGNSDYNTGRMHCVSDIKDHFGIGK